MKDERRVLVILVVLGVLAVPAAVLRVLCVGRACVDEAATARRVPFCSLPEPVRKGIAAGYREGRSPDILGVTRRDFEIYSPGVDPFGSPWPSLGRPTTNVPVVFLGQGVAPGTKLPTDFGLDDIAPTLSDVIGFDIPHPEVRSGRSAEGVATGEEPRLVAVIVLRRVGEAVSDLVLAALAEKGAATMTASPGSLPLDTAALLTTIGTGGIPAEHGITGTVVKNDNAKAAEAWFARELGVDRDLGLRVEAPRSVIATLADDLDEELRQEPKIGLVSDELAGRGLVGGNWYVDNDRDMYRFVRTDRIAGTVREALATGFGRDQVVDLLGISFRVSRLEGATEALHLYNVLQKATDNRAAVAIVALPRIFPLGSEVDGSVLADRLSGIEPHLVDADTAGGIFIDQDAFSRAGATKDEIVQTLREFRYRGADTFADVFPDLAVSFARFC